MLLVIVVLLSQLVVNMADGRAAKLRRLDASRRRLPYISAQALAAVYKDVLEHGVPEMRARNNLMEATKPIKGTLKANTSVNMTRYSIKPINDCFRFSKQNPQGNLKCSMSSFEFHFRF